MAAGSDKVKQTEEACALNYEMNILKRVVKSQKHRPTRAQRIRIDEGTSQSSGTDSAVAGGPWRSVEQGVDEILHLKIAQSLIDTEVPSTIVLASGDAAEAEFSDGFLKMLERGLQRGWRVEVVAFRSNVSAAYRARAWRKRWGSSFSIIELDDYADLLLNE